MADNVILNLGTGGATAASREISHGGDTAQLQGVFLMGIAGAEGSYTAAALNGDATNGLDVDITRANFTGAVDTAAGATQIGIAALTVRDDALATLTEADGDLSLHRVNARGALWVALDATTAQNVTVAAALPAGTNNIGDVDVLTVPADPFGANADAASATGSISAKLRFIAATGIPITSLPTLAAVTTVATVTNVATIGTSVVPGTGATHLGKAEDAAHTTGDTGVMTFAVRRDANTSLVDTTGDYAPLQVDATGNLKVAIISGAGSGGTSIADAAAFTRATTSITPIGGVVETSAPTLTNGNAGAISLTTGGAVRVSVAAGGIAGVVEDAAAAGGEEGIMILGVRRDTPASSSGTDGDFSTFNFNSTGALYVTGGGGGTQFAVDTAAGGTDTGTLSLAVRDDALATLTPVDNDYTQFRTNARGALWVALDSTVAQNVTLAAETTKVIGTVNISAAQTITLSAGTATNEVVGDVAHDGVAAGNPVLIGARASAAVPTDVSADNDVTELWALRSGALAVQPTYAGVLSVAGNGASGTGVQRVTIANDSTGVIATVASVTNVVAIGTSVTPGVSAGHLGKAEDAAHASGDTGVAVWAVRSDTLAASSGTTGDYEAFHTDSVGALWTRNANEIADDAAFTPGTSRVQPIGFTADEAATDSVDEGDIGAARMTLDRKVIVTPYVHPAAGGWTPSCTVSAASTNATSLKASAGKIGQITVSNVNAAIRYLKFYNKASAPTVGTDPIVYQIPIPGNTAGAGAVIDFGEAGLQFTTGIAWALTTEATSAGTTGVAANEIVVSIAYN